MKTQRKAAPVTVTRAGGDTEVVAASRFKRKQRYKFALSSVQRMALLRGEIPRITIPSGERPFEPGESWDIPGTKNLSIGIIGYAEGGEGLDVLIYSLYDQRPRLLRASVHGIDYDSIRRSMDSGGVPSPLEDSEAVTQAAEESAYTTSPGAALSHEPEAISRAEQEDQARAKREKRERQIRSPIAAIKRELAKMEADPLFTGHESTVRFLRNRLAKLEAEALGS